MPTTTYFGLLYAGVVVGMTSIGAAVKMVAGTMGGDGGAVDADGTVDADVIGTGAPVTGGGNLAKAAAACGPPPNVDKNTFINVIMKMATIDKLFTRSASFISVRLLTLNLQNCRK